MIQMQALKIAKKLIKISLSSFILISCSGKYPDKIYSVDIPRQQFNGYKVESFDDNLCEFKLSDAEVRPFSDPEMDGAVTITRKEYKRLQGHYKAECLNQKTKAQNPIQ